MANYLSVSEAVKGNDGAWSQDKSQAFYLPDGVIENKYLRVVGIRRKREITGENIAAEADSESYSFVVYMTAGTRFFRGEFTIS